MKPEEISIPLGPLTLAARAWGPQNGRPVLALHGWLDNAATWDRLAPLVCARSSDPLRIVSIDLPGHGSSDHFAPGGWYGFPDYLLTVHRTLDALGWTRATLWGHSMGGAIATLYAGAFPDRVAALALVEGLTPLTTAAEDAPETLRKGVVSHLKYAAQTPRTYPDLATIEARFAARPWKLTQPAVKALAARGSVAVDGGRAFTHDPRLKAGSLIRFTPAQVRSFLSQVTAPALLFIGNDGLEYRKQEVESYLDVLSDVRVEQVQGRHHVHLDSPELLLPHVASFMAETA